MGSLSRVEPPAPESVSLGLVGESEHEAGRRIDAPDKAVQTIVDDPTRAFVRLNEVQQIARVRHVRHRRE